MLFRSILDVQKSANAFTNLFYGTNSNTSSSSAALITVKSDVAALDIGVLGSATSGFSNYGNAKGVFLRGDASSTSFHVLYQTKYVLAVDGYTSTPTFKADGGYAAFNVPLATSISGTILTVRGETSDNSGYALKVQNSSSSALLYVRNDGVVLMNNLPTSSAGLPSGALWNNSGVINIV